MKISILTPSFNQRDYIEQNILAVLSQNYSNFEHIIIDGGSTDNTLDILNKYPHLLWISEPDQGQADALNKGLAMATGDIIGWINSDDYYEDNIFNDVISNFKDYNTKWIIGNITYYYTELGIMRPISSDKITYENLLKNPDIVKQPGVFFRKELLIEDGGWSTDYYMVMDLDLWVRIARKYHPKMVNRNYAYFLWHTNQKSSPINLIRQAGEINEILKANNVTFLSRLPILIKKYIYFIKGIVKLLLINLHFIDKKFSTIPFSRTKNIN